MVTELKTGLEKFAVVVQVPKGEQVIGAGPITGSISAVRVMYQGQAVTEVPEGEYFDVEVDFTAQNPGGLYWAACCTMIATDGTLPNYDVSRTIVPSSTISGTMKLDSMGKPGPMPGNDVTLRIKLWGNQAWTTDPPPQDQW